MTNQLIPPSDKPTNNDTKKPSTKLKTGKVKDDISKGRTVSGSKPDEININPMMELQTLDQKFASALNELNIQQRLKKSMNMRRIEGKIQLAKKKAMLRRGSGKVIAKRARTMAIQVMKSKLSGGRSTSDLSAMEKQRVEDLVKRRKGAVNRLALRLIPAKKKTEAKRFLKKEHVDLNDVFESVNFINEMIEQVNGNDVKKREWGTSTLTKRYKNDTPGEKSIDEQFQSFVEQSREAIPRSGQKRKEIDLVVRDGSDRKVSTKPYRQQEIQKKIIDEDLEQIVDVIDEALDWIDRGEYDYEGAMARTQLMTICRSAQELVDILKDDENMPEWVQSKITKAEDYISSVNDYLKSRYDLNKMDNRMSEDYETPVAKKDFGKTDHYQALDDLDLNIANRNHTIDEYSYGPLNPNDAMGSQDFWLDKADLWNTSVDAAKTSQCGNCAAFNQSKKIIDKIHSGLGPEGEKISNLANLGFCEIFEFKCAAARTCDAWLKGGPILDGQSVKEEVWDKPNPVKNHQKLSPQAKSKAKARAKAAGRTYPNMVDNMWAAKNESVDEAFDEVFGCPLDEDMEIHELIEEDFMPTGEELYEDWNEIEEEAEKNGRKVKLGKPFLTPGGPKKRSVYVKNDNGNVVKVNFGDPNMTIKKNIPARRKSFRARHNCETPGPRDKARYWSCKQW